MAKSNLKGALKTEKIGSFGGIYRNSTETNDKNESGSFSAWDICNFRILPDGSIEKREGFSPLMTLSGEPRAFWNGYIDGHEMSLALIESSIYSVDIENERQNLLGSVASSEGKAEFFFYRGNLYLIDGDNLYEFDGEEFFPVCGYVPLYKKDADGNYTPEIYEDVNFLSDKIRIHFHLKDIKQYFNFGIKCSEILYFGRRDSDFTSEATLSEDGMYLTTENGIPAGSDIFVYLRLSDEYCLRNRLTASRRATVYGGVDDGRILLYDGNNKSEVFASKYVPSRDLSESRRFDQNSSVLYFPISGTVNISYGRYPITSMCRHYDRLLIFTEKETWMADFTRDSDLPYIVPINSSIGCLSEDGAAMGGNNPYTVSEGGIYRWTSKDDERDECNAFCVSVGINDMLDTSFFDHAVAYYNRCTDEVWFSDPDSDEQIVWVYSISGNKWFRFDGIPVDSFFTYRGRVATIYGKYIFSFSKENTVDIGIGGTVKSNIEAFYESNPTDFGYPERSKHLKRVQAKTIPSGDALSLSFECDRGGRKLLEIDETGSSDVKYPTNIDARIDIGRFREMYYAIHASGKGRPRIISLRLTAFK
ncbi:MAG: hypothetical protein U0M06_07615 [Clostridia bacterium]|nr:hypothetical protein [Clostridia bacterium]